MGKQIGEKAAYAAWMRDREIYGKGSAAEIDSRNRWLKAASRNKNACAKREIVADMCGTLYAAAKRDMGL